jgi:putative membrane protein
VYAGIHFPFSLFGSMMRLLLIWLINTIALFVLPLILQSVQIDSFTTALVAALVLGLINTLIRPILILLTFPVTVLTLGLFILVVNGLMFWAASDLVQGFQVAGFYSAVLGALIYSVISWLLSAIFIRK